MRNEKVELIKTSYTVDAIGQRVPNETVRAVFCAVNSVSGSEWFSAGQNNIKATYQIVVDLDDYQNEKIAVFEGVRYSIYRTYRTKENQIELYLEEKEGI